MAKKKATKRKSAKKESPPTAKRIDASEFGIDLFSILNEIKPYLDGMTQKQIGEQCGMPQASISNLFREDGKRPSLGAVAAIAKASGGKLTVNYEPPKSKGSK